jgi:hypothetical protein
MVSQNTQVQAWKVTCLLGIELQQGIFYFDLAGKYQLESGLCSRECIGLLQQIS